jgi:hypothetical protein
MFFLAPDCDGVANHSPVLASDIQEYRRNLERLDDALCKIENYIHVAFAVVKKEDIVRRMFTMVSFSMIHPRITSNVTGSRV